MTRKRWVPLHYRVPGGPRVGHLIHAGTEWEIYRVTGGGRVLLSRCSLAERWVAEGLVPDTALEHFVVGAEGFRLIASVSDQRLEPVAEGKPPDSKADAVAFALSLRETRRVGGESPLHDALYVERFSRLLPTWTVSERASDEKVLGRWLTGGVPISASSLRRLTALVGFLDEEDVTEVVRVAGFCTASPLVAEQAPCSGADSVSLATIAQKRAAIAQEPDDARSTSGPDRRFHLAGRRMLEAFLGEHVIDIVENPQRYEALGIGFPSSMVLHGPPGCGKTFALERLTEYLDWPIFYINSSSIGSPYIHETARRVSALFDQAISSAPSVLVIEEMESYLSDRQINASAAQHHVEEVGEFLRRIPDAQERRVLVIGTTNRLEMIDPAILRRGRFDHVVKVELPSAVEVEELLDDLLSQVPMRKQCDTTGIVNALTGRALSDAAFVVRESARLAAKAGKEAVDAESLQCALRALPPDETERPIGFLQN